MGAVCAVRVFGNESHWRKFMLIALVKSCALAGCIVMLPFSVSSQQVVHALTGTVSSIDKASETIAVLQDVGGDGVFQNPANPKTKVALDKKIEPGTVAAEAFNSRMPVPPFPDATLRANGLTPPTTVPVFEIRIPC